MSASELAVAAAHELKNPVMLAMAHVGLIRLADETPVIRAHCDRIEQALLEINALATMFIQISGGALKTDGAADVDITLLLQAITNEYRAAWPEIRFIYEPPAYPLWFTGEETQLHMIFTNMIKNAVEAAGPRGRVTITAEAADGFMRIAVRDDGQGLDETTLHKLTTGKFTSKPGGSGMGLMVCQMITARCGGRFELGNCAQGGGESVVTLPHINK